MTEHDARDAHGTVKAELATLNEAIKGLMPRIVRLENHAGEGERYTERDHREDREFLMTVLESINKRISILEER